MIQISDMRGGQFMKSRTLHLPVVVVDAHTFRMPSSRGGERDHTVTFNSSESPTAVSCTCEAGEHNTPCWAMARALDALTVLGVNNIYIGRTSSPERQPDPGTSAEISSTLRASVNEQGEMALLRGSETAHAGMVLLQTIP